MNVGVTCHLVLLKSLEKVLQKEKEDTLKEGEIFERD